MTNIDPSEINKFDQIAHRFWDLNGEFKALHEINPLRLQFIDQHAKVAKKRVLDVGCGGGILAEAIALMDAEVIGIDMAADALEVARLHALEQQISLVYQQNTAEEFARKHPAQFDVVCCMEMLEHVPSPESVMRALASLVTDGGIVVVSTLNRNIKSYLGAILVAENLLNLIPKGTHRHDKFIKPSELASWGREAGLDLIAIEGINYNPLNQSYSRGGNIDINYMAAFASARPSS